MANRNPLKRFLKDDLTMSKKTIFPAMNPAGWQKNMMLASSIPKK